MLSRRILTASAAPLRCGISTNTPALAAALDATRTQSVGGAAAELVFPATNPRSDVNSNDIAHAAASSGIYTVPQAELSSLKAPFDSITGLFDLLYRSPALSARLNATYPKRGVFKTAGLRNSAADQKVTIDLSAIRLENMAMRAPELATELGSDFKGVLEFFASLEGQLLPKAFEATNAAAGIDMKALHAQRNYNYRLVDYFAKEGPVKAGDTARCDVHRDYGTFSVIFQNGESGLEYVDSTTGDWKAVPADHAAIVWGWCSAILSGDRIHAAVHRVQSTAPGSRRQTAVLFAAPDLKTPLRPLAGSSAGFTEAIQSGQVTVDEFKNISGKQWRVREGNEKGPVLAMGGPDTLEAFVRGL